MMRYYIIVLMAMIMYSCQGTKDGMVTIPQDSLNILVDKAAKYDDSQETEEKYKMFLAVTEDQKKHMQELEDSLLNNGNDTRILESVIKEANARMGEMKAICDDYKNEPAIHIQELRNNTENEMRKWSGFYAYILNQAKNLKLTRDSLKFFKDQDTVYILARKEIESKKNEIEKLKKQLAGKQEEIDQLVKDRDHIIDVLDSTTNILDSYTLEATITDISLHKPKSGTKYVKIDFKVNWNEFKEQNAFFYIRIYPPSPKNPKQYSKELLGKKNDSDYNFLYSCKVEKTNATKKGKYSLTVKYEDKSLIEGNFRVQVYLKETPMPNPYYPIDDSVKEVKKIKEK